MCFLGAIRGLEQNGIQIDYLAAHSGAATLLCYIFSGLTDEQIIQEFSQFRFWHYFSLNPFP